MLSRQELRVGNYMTSPVVTAGVDEGFLDATSEMASKGIGTLVIMDRKNKVAGVLTEREMLYYLVVNEGIPDKSIGYLVNKKFSKVSPYTDIRDAAKTMVTKNNRLLVFDEGELTGIITASDMVRAFLQRRRNPPLKGIARQKVFTVHPDSTILDAVKAMLKKRIGSVIVTAGDKGRRKSPSGIFTERDLLVKVLAQKIDLLERVGSYSSYPMVTAKTGIGAKDAAQIMSSNKIKRLPLTRRGKIVAMVTARDLVSALLK